MNNRKEYLEFLDLDENAQAADIARSIEAKEIVFKQLLQNAPNEYLRQIHARNLQTLTTIREHFRGHAPLPPVASSPAPEQQPTPLVHGWLIRHTENMEPLSFPLYTGDNYIGRLSANKANEIIIDKDIYISRTHAILTVSNNTFTLVDCKSKNGTFINANEKRITSPLQLHEGDTLQIGNTKFVLKLKKNNNAEKAVQEVERSDYMKTVVINLL